VLTRIFALFWLVLAPFVLAAGEAEILAPLITPQKIDALDGSRAANPRLKKIAYWMESARRDGQDVAAVIDQAQRKVGYAGTARADVEKAGLLRNLTILERLGCLSDDGMAKLRKGTLRRSHEVPTSATSLKWTTSSRVPRYPNSTVSSTTWNSCQVG
jgi:hypothetical protein